METLALLGIVMLLLALRQSVILILIVCVAYVQLVWAGGSLVFLVDDIWTAMDSYALLAIPVFIMAGGIMSRGTTAGRLVDIIRALTDWMPGGLGVAVVLSCALFSAISGSSSATLLAVGAIMLPALREAGYTDRFSLGALTSAGTLGILIPPSIPLIVYAIVTNQSVVDMFRAALIPGLLVTGVFAVYSLWVNRNIRSGSFELSRFITALRHGIWALMLPVILLGGIYSGIFSPTEAAAVAVGYAAFVELVITRELKVKDLMAIAVETARMLGTLYPIIAVALSIKTVLAIEGVPQDVADWISAGVSSPIAFLILMNIVLLIVGCFLDVISATLLLAPILVVAGAAFGIDPVHLGIIMVLNLEIGLLTPPIGLNLLVASTAFRAKFSMVLRSVVPFCLLMIACLLIVTLGPYL